MSIDVKNETLIRLADVPKLKWLPGRRGGRRLNVSTVFRWTQPHRQIRLEAVRVGGALCTTEAALMRFFERQANPAAAQPLDNTKAHERAERDLDAAGI
jgi:hypothetical protein